MWESLGDGWVHSYRSHILEHRNGQVCSGKNDWVSLLYFSLLLFCDGALESRSTDLVISMSSFVVKYQDSGSKIQDKAMGRQQTSPLGFRSELYSSIKQEGLLGFVTYYHGTRSVFIVSFEAVCKTIRNPLGVTKNILGIQ